MNNKRKFIGYHGDVDMFQIDHLPKGAKLIGKFKSYVVQHGESGHKHTLTSDVEFEVYKIKERWIYLLNAPAELSHEEHRTHEIGVGIFEQDQELEESAQDGMVRPVVD